MIYGVIHGSPRVHQFAREALGVFEAYLTTDLSLVDSMPELKNIGGIVGKFLSPTNYVDVTTGEMVALDFFLTWASDDIVEIGEQLSDMSELKLLKHARERWNGQQAS